MLMRANDTLLETKILCVDLGSPLKPGERFSWRLRISGLKVSERMECPELSVKEGFTSAWPNMKAGNMVESMAKWN